MSTKRQRPSTSLRSSVDAGIATESKRGKQSGVPDLTARNKGLKRRRPSADLASTPAGPVQPSSTMPAGSRVVLLHCLFEGKEAVIVRSDGDGGFECALKDNERVKVWVGPDDLLPIAPQEAQSAGVVAASTAETPHGRSATSRRSPRLIASK